MSEEKKDTKLIKDPERKSFSYGAGISSVSLNSSYARTNKLITALYMVTDIMDKEEPLRLKLRTLGVEILSDMCFAPSQAGSASKLSPDTKIQEVLSFLDIASAIGMISEMNCSILKREFIRLKESIQEPSQNLMLSEFFVNEPEMSKVPFDTRENSKGHSTNVGIQKGNTLLKALNKVEGMKALNKKVSDKSNFDVLKQQRRESILKILKDKDTNEMSIKDIVLALRSIGEEWGEKTLQRELISMVKDGVLERTGEKRWSRYRLGSRF